MCHWRNAKDAETIFQVSWKNLIQQVMLRIDIGEKSSFGLSQSTCHAEHDLQDRPAIQEMHSGGSSEPDALATWVSAEKNNRNWATVQTSPRIG